MLLSTGLTMLAISAVASSTPTDKPTIDQRMCAQRIDSGIQRRDERIGELEQELETLDAQKDAKIDEQTELELEQTELELELKALREALPKEKDKPEGSPQPVATELKAQEAKYKANVDAIAKVNTIIGRQERELTRLTTKRDQLDTTQNEEVNSLLDGLGRREKRRCEKQAKNERLEQAKNERLERVIDQRVCAQRIDPGIQRRDERIGELEQELETLDAQMGAKADEKVELEQEDKALKQELKALRDTLEGPPKPVAAELKAQEAELKAQEAKYETNAGALAKIITIIGRQGEEKTRLTTKLEQLNTEQNEEMNSLLAGLGKREKWRCERQAKNERLERVIDLETRTFRGIMSKARTARCATALCWGPSNKFAFEPLAEIPIGKSFALHRSGLGRYINGSDIQVSFNAGLRFWMAWDWVSLSTYLSKPLFSAAEVITVQGSSHQFSGSQVRRPYPGVALGLFGDFLWLSMDWDQLRNGNSGELRAPEFRPNDAISHTVTFTFAIAPLAAIRNGLGALAQKRKGAKDDERTAISSEGPAGGGEVKTGRTETGRTETGRTETGRTETGRTETGRTETGRTETDTTETDTTEPGGPS